MPMRRELARSGLLLRRLTMDGVYICTACGRPGAERGCSPGRCFSPRAHQDERPQLPPRPKAAPARKLGPRRKVIHAELREAEGGRLFWVLALECGCRVWYPAGRDPKPARRSSVCTGCGSRNLTAADMGPMALALAVAVIVLPDLARLLDLVRSPRRWPTGGLEAADLVHPRPPAGDRC